ncbi:MAG: TM2 domain-containing protein [Treponema sp.]|nr:TM2 domain-containing protein [Treponema sp.]MDY4130403.1 TM2 domain-containing protein [Treponema sp.]
MVLSEEKELKSPKKKSIAILLCLIFFGVFGLHRFYVGKIKTGGLLLLISCFSAGSVGVIWGLYDLFTLLFTNKFTDADGLPLS